MGGGRGVMGNPLVVNYYNKSIKNIKPEAMDIGFPYFKSTSGYEQPIQFSRGEL